jgi:hypothetical protein
MIAKSEDLREIDMDNVDVVIKNVQKLTPTHVEYVGESDAENVYTIKVIETPAPHRPLGHVKIAETNARYVPVKAAKVWTADLKIEERIQLKHGVIYNVSGSGLRRCLFVHANSSIELFEGHRHFINVAE